MGTVMADERLIALPADRAAQLAGVSERRVRSWAERGLVTPTVERRISEHRTVRLYGHRDLLCLLVTAELISRGASPQTVRKIVEHLRSRGYDEPLSQLVFAVDERDGQVYFQHPTGEWEGGKRPDQIVLHQVLNLKPLIARIRRAARRADHTVGQTEKRRGALGSKPVVAGTRVPVATIARYLDRGASTEDVLRAFPVLRAADVEAVRRKAS